MNNTNIFGFDFGHGDTSLASLILDLGKNERPEKVKLFGSDKQITAISTVNGITHIGEAAYDLSNSKNLRIAFKKRPSRATEEEKSLMKKYVSTLYEHLIKSNQISEIETNIFCIGCPSGWTEADKNAYQALFLECGIPEVVIVRESRAALIHAYESEKLTTGSFINSIVLVVDVGSSTTDITITQGEKDKLVDSGYELGATFIDKMLLEHCLNLEKNKELKKICSERKDIKMLCELNCRINKEDFFNKYKFFQNNSIIRLLPIDQGLEFRFEIDINSMNKLLNQRLGDNLDTKIALENDLNSIDIINNSWKEAFRKALNKAKNNIDEIIEKTNLSFNSILLTGGASQMSFISEICMEVFPNITPNVDTKPEYTIAYGLSRWGRTDIITKQFENDINLFVQKELPKIIKSEYSRLTDMLTESLSAEMVEKVVKKRIIAWRDGYIYTLNDLSSDIANQTKKWLKGHEANQLIQSTIESWLVKVSAKVEKETNAICAKYQLSSNSLIKKNTDEFKQVNSSGFNANVSIGDPTDMGEILGTILGVLIIVLAEIFVLTGPAGWILGIIAFFAGQTFAENAIQDANLPKFIRKLVTDDKIKDSAAKTSPEIENKLKSALRENSSLENELTAKIADWMSKGIEDESKKARLLII